MSMTLLLDKLQNVKSRTSMLNFWSIVARGQIIRNKKRKCLIPFAFDYVKGKIKEKSVSSNFAKLKTKTNDAVPKTE